MSTKTTDFSVFSVEELKEKLRELGIKTSGNKAELINRLMQADPSGGWTKNSENRTVVAQEDEIMDSPIEGASERMILQKELEISRREQELIRKELELAQREIDLLRGIQQLNVNNQGEALEKNQRINTSARAAGMSSVHGGNDIETSSRLNITSIIELLGNFDGRSDMYETWERQVIFLKNTYKLTDDVAKVMIGSRLKGKALEFLHSRAEYITLPVDDFLVKLRNMFNHRPSRVQARKQFEQRVWKRDETFSSYMHDKVILANRTSIDEDELIEYIIEGIPDQMLRDQARVQRLRSQEYLLEAFEGVSLRGRFQHTSTYPRNEDKPKSRKTEDHEKQETVKTKRCHNCGLRNHYATDCPMKGKGTKCFSCQEFGHIAAKCPKKINEIKSSCNVSNFVTRKYGKEVKMQNQNLTALIDTGSDLSLMRAEQYIRLGAPSLVKKEIKFR